MSFEEIEFSKVEEICFSCYSSILSTDDSLALEGILPPVAVSEQNLNFSVEFSCRFTWNLLHNFARQTYMTMFMSLDKDQQSRFRMKEKS